MKGTTLRGSNENPLYALFRKKRPKRKEGGFDGL